MAVKKLHPRTFLLTAVLLSIFLSGTLACGLPVTIVPGTNSPVSTLTAELPGTAPSAPTAAVLPTAVASPTTPPLTAPPASQVLQPTSPAISQVQIYLVALEGGGTGNLAIGCGDRLVPVARPVTPTNQPIVAALTQLFAIKQQNYGQSGLYNALWQSNLRVATAAVDADGVAAVALIGQYTLGGECDTPRFKGQIEQTILSVPGVKATHVLLNGKPIDQALSLK